MSKNSADTNSVFFSIHIKNYFISGEKWLHVTTNEVFRSGWAHMKFKNNYSSQSRIRRFIDDDIVDEYFLQIQVFIANFIYWINSYKVFMREKVLTYKIFSPNISPTALPFHRSQKNLEKTFSITKQHIKTRFL